MTRTTACRWFLTMVAAVWLLGSCGASGGEGGATPEGQSDPSSATTGSERCTPSGATGDLERSVDVGGQPRTYRLHVPTGLTGRVPLVVTAHGLASTAEQQLAITEFGKLGDEEGFITAAPQAQGIPSAWNFLLPTSVPASDGAYLRSMLRDIAQQWCIDPERRFLTGISNGSALTFAAACTEATAFAAFGGVAGALFVPPCDQAPSRPIIYFHGTADQVVPIGGGRALFAEVEPALDTMAAWARHDGCTRSSKRQATAAVALRRWSGCRDDAEVAYYEIEGGGHTWPGSPVDQVGLGPTNRELFATELMWRFFEAHPGG